MAEVGPWVVSSAMLPLAPPPVTADQYAGLLESSFMSRLRISSAYTPPSPEWLISSRNSPNWVGLIWGPACEASTVSVPAPASCLIALALSTPEYARTSSIRPETKSTRLPANLLRPTASGPLAAQLPPNDSVS